MNHNRIETDTWSNPKTEEKYNREQLDPALSEKYQCGDQCGGCSFFAAFNADWGLCCNCESKHFLETVFEHYTCDEYVHEGWGPHSFTKDKEFQCRCGGESSEEWDRIIEVLREYETPARQKNEPPPDISSGDVTP